MVDLDIRRGQLARLIETLDDLLAILQLDSTCLWAVQFEQFLQTAQRLFSNGFTQAELDDFSRSVCRMYDRHADGFCDYRPPATLKAEGLHGTDNFETFTRAVNEQALNLRVIDR